MLAAIIEEADTNAEEKDIKFVNAGVMAFSSKIARQTLFQLNNENAQGEYYLTDLVALARAEGAKIGYVIAQEDEVLGVNSRTDLARAEGALQHRLRQAAMAQGVTLQAPKLSFYMRIALSSLMLPSNRMLLLARIVIYMKGLLFVPSLILRERLLVIAQLLDLMPVCVKVAS